MLCNGLHGHRWGRRRCGGRSIMGASGHGGELSAPSTLRCKVRKATLLQKCQHGRIGNPPKSLQHSFLTSNVPWEGCGNECVQSEKGLWVKITYQEQFGILMRHLCIQCPPLKLLGKSYEFPTKVLQYPISNWHYYNPTFPSNAPSWLPMTPELQLPSLIPMLP